MDGNDFPILSVKDLAIAYSCETSCQDCYPEICFTMTKMVLYSVSNLNYCIFPENFYLWNYSRPNVTLQYFSILGIPISHFLGYNKGSALENAKQHLFGGFTRFLLFPKQILVINFRNTRQKRILECFWRFSFYTSAFIYGCVVLWVFSLYLFF